MSTSAIGEAFRRVCTDKADLVAIHDLDGHAHTFTTLLVECLAIRRALTDVGATRGSCVVSAIGNRSVFVPLMVACMDLGAALLPVGEATDNEIAALIAKVGAFGLVTDRPVLIPAARETIVCGDVRVLGLREGPPFASPGESVVLKLTSGSTDLPKAAVASEVQMINDGRHIVEAMGITPTDVNLAWIPFSHSFALGNLIMPLIWQGTSLALRRRFTPSQLVSDLMASAATVFPGVPFMFDYIRRNESIPGLPRTLRLLISAGAPIDIHTVEWFHRHLDRKIHSFYGSSETGGITYDDSEEVTDPLHVGHAMPETTVTIKSPDRERADGRIFVQGTAVSSGYAGTGSVDAAAAFQEGGFLTGDLGHFDRECRLVLTGRASPLVNVAGRKVDPVEIEHALLQLQGVADARVLGMTCDTRGEQVVAFVVRDDVSLTALGLRQLCAAKLSAHKIPRRFIFVEDFPVDARGKIDRQRLQTLASPQN